MRSLLSLAVLVSLIVAACGIAPGSTSPPTSSPTGAPTGSPAPTDTPAPTPSPTLNPELIQHPTGPTDIVLRMEQGGGFVPMGWMLTQAPQFTLYGDGTVVFRPLEDEGRLFGESALGLPRFRQGRLTEEGIQALLQFALGPGRLANAREQYDDPMIADATTTTFNLNAGGAEKVVSIYALAEMMAGGRDAADRQGFAQLANLLNNFETEAADDMGEVTLYQPPLYRVTLLEAFGEPVGAPGEWPWDDLTVDDFPAGDEPGGIAHLTAEQVGLLTEVPSGGHPGIWVETPDGDVVQLGVRPLLPDEVAAFESV